MGGIVGLGNVFRFAAQQLSKLLNNVFPGAGSAISSAIATSGTIAIGNAAIAYYIEGLSLEDVKKKFEEMKNKN